MKKISKKNAQTLGDWAYLAIKKHFQQILNHETGVLADKDPEELHQMRVGMRRLRSAISGFSPALNLPQTAQENKVAKTARQLGKLRDLDVLGEALKQQYYPQLPKQEQKLLQQALKVLKKRRLNTFKKVKILLHQETYCNLKQGYKDWLEKPSYQEIAQLPIYLVLTDLLLPQICQFLRHPGWFVGVTIEPKEIQTANQLGQSEVKKLLTRHEKTVHDLRKEAKRSRYQMELFTQFYDDNYQNYLKEIKMIQSLLGEIQDCFVLREFLTQIFASNLNRKMPVLDYQFTQIRYQKWTKWQEIQGRFLHSSTRREFRQTIEQFSF